MKEYSRASAIDTFILIQEGVYNTYRPTDVLIEELIEIIRFLEERIKLLESYQ